MTQSLLQLLWISSQVNFYHKIIFLQRLLTLKNKINGNIQIQFWFFLFVRVWSTMLETCIKSHQNWIWLKSNSLIHNIIQSLIQTLNWISKRWGSTIGTGGKHLKRRRRNIFWNDCSEWSGTFHPTSIYSI